MATRKAASLDADLIARKGEATPAQPPTPTAPTPQGTRHTIALTVRLDPERYQRLASAVVDQMGHTQFCVVETDDITKLQEFYRPWRGIARAEVRPVRDLMNPS